MKKLRRGSQPLTRKEAAAILEVGVQTFSEYARFHGVVAIGQDNEMGKGGPRNLYHASDVAMLRRKRLAEPPTKGRRKRGRL